ncbi:hypothetical protein RYX36_030697 [Vicia faba]
MTSSKASCSFLRIYLIIVSCLAFQCNADDQISTLFVNASHGSGRPIPNTLFGIFFETYPFEAQRMFSNARVFDKTPRNGPKIANIGNNKVKLKISLDGFGSKFGTASTKTVLTSKNALDENSFLDPKKITPQQSQLKSLSNEMNVIIPPVSLTVFDMLR